MAAEKPKEFHTFNELRNWWLYHRKPSLKTLVRKRQTKAKKLATP